MGCRINKTTSSITSPFTPISRYDLTNKYSENSTIAFNTICNKIIVKKNHIVGTVLNSIQKSWKQSQT